MHGPEFFVFERSSLFQASHALPTPIAQPLRRLHRARTKIDEAAALLETTHQTMHFLVALAAADLASVSSQNDPLENALDEMVSGSSPLRWWAFMQQWGQANNDTHLPELRAAVLGLGENGEQWVQATQHLNDLLLEPGIGMSTLESAAEHLSSDAVFADLQCFITGLSFLNEWSILNPTVTWREGSAGLAVATRLHGHSPSKQGLLSKRVEGRLHAGWPILVRHDTGLALSLYPLVMVDSDPIQLRPRVLFNKAESNPETGATRERWWGERTTTGLLQRLRSGEHSAFEVDTDTLMRLRLLEPVSGKDPIHLLASPDAYRVGVEEDPEGYKFWISLSPESSRIDANVEAFANQINAIRGSGRGMLRTDPMHLRQEWNAVSSTVYSSTPFCLSEVLREERPLNRNASLILADSILEHVERSLQAGMELSELSMANFFVDKDFGVEFIPLPAAGTGEVLPILEGLSSLLTLIGEEDPGLFKGAIQALSMPLGDDPLLHRIRITRAQLSELDEDVPALGRGPVGTMSLVQMSSPIGVAQRLCDLVEANPSESDVVEGLRFLASDTWPESTRLDILTQALLHPFVSTVEGRELELSHQILAISSSHEDASRVLEAHLRGEEDWGGLSSLLLRRFSFTSNRIEKKEILASLSRIFEEELQSQESAFLVYQKALENDPEDSESLQGAMRIAEKGELWEELYNLLVHLITRLEGPEKAAVELEAATIAAEQLGLFHKAIAHLEEVLKERRDDANAWMLLAHLLTEVERFHDAISAWESTVRFASQDQKVLCLSNGADCAEKANEWHRCVQFLELRAVYEDRISAAFTCAQIAEICLDKLGDISHADSALARAEALAPDEPDVRAAVRGVASRSGDALREASLEEIAAAGDDADLRETALRRAIQSKDRIGLSGEELVLFFRELVALAPADLEPMHSFYELLIGLDEWEEADTIMGLRIEHTEDPDAKVELLMERAQHLRVELEKPETAANLLLQASEIRPDDERLAKAHVHALREAHDSNGVIRALVRRAEMTPGNGKADLYVEAARMEIEANEAVDKAIGLLEKGLDAIPDHPTASMLLAGHYIDRKDTAKAIPLLTLWAESIEEAGNQEEAFNSWIRVGELSSETELWERSIAAYARARKAKPEEPNAWVGEARAQSAMGHADAAMKLYREVLGGSAGSVSAAIMSTVQRELSTLTAQDGSTTESRELLEKALASSEPDKGTLATLIALCQAEEDWKAASEYRAQMIPLVGSSKERAKLFLEQGKALSSRLGMAEEALDALGESLLLDPTSRVVIAATLEAALMHQEYAKAVEMLNRLAELETDEEKRGHHLLASAIIYRDHLHDELRAIGALNDALNFAPLLLEAFEALDAIHVHRMDFQAQAESYERMLSRVADFDGTEDLVFQLLLNHASLLRKLNDLPKAIDALERARVFRPSDVQVHMKLARNYEESPDCEEEAIDAYHTLLLHDPKNVDAYQALRRLFTRTKETDAAWCACGGLVFLGAADEKENAFYEAHRQGALKVSKPLQGDGPWIRNLYPIGMIAEVGILMDALYQRHPDWFVASSPEELGLDASTKITLSTKSSFTNFARTIPKILGIPVPEFHESDVIHGIRKASTDRPLAIVSSDIFENVKGKLLRFLLGRNVAFFHPFHSVAGVRGERELQGLLDTLHLLHHEPDTTDALAAKLRGQFEEDELENYVQLAPGVFSDTSPPSVREWLIGVDVAASRTGLLLCNDLGLAIAELKASGGIVSDLSGDELAERLIRFSVSRDYSSLRKLLGISLP